MYKTSCWKLPLEGSSQMSTHFFVALQSKATGGDAVAPGGSEQPPLPATSQPQGLAGDGETATMASGGSGPQAPAEEVAIMKLSTDIASAPPPSNAQVLGTCCDCLDVTWVY